MRHSFKNFRRRYEKEHDESAQPASKHLRLDDTDQPDIMKQLKNYRVIILTLKQSVTFVENIFPEAYRRKGKKGSQNSTVKQLMEKLENVDISGYNKSIQWSQRSQKSFPILHQVDGLVDY